MRIYLELFIVFLLVFSSSQLFAQQCENDNAALQSMGRVNVTFTRADGSSFELEAKYANDSLTRAAGFQRVCPERVESTLILFEFEDAMTPQFHMNNVVAPLDIAFIDENGRVESTQLMNIYSLLMVSTPLYSPSRPVIAALEAHKGFYQQHNIDVSSKISWEVVAGQDKN